MRNFFHITVSVILGSLLGYGLYYKILNKRVEAKKASDIAVDELFFADHAAFERKQQEAMTLARTTVADTLQVSLQFFETTKSSKSASGSVKINDARTYHIIEAKRPIEVAQLQKAKTVSIPVSKVSAPEIIEVASATISPTIQEVSAASATSTDNSSDSQPQADKKKKFLFFNKKSKND